MITDQRAVSPHDVEVNMVNPQQGNTPPRELEENKQGRKNTFGCLASDRRAIEAIEALCCQFLGSLQAGELLTLQIPKPTIEEINADDMHEHFGDSCLQRSLVNLVTTKSFAQMFCIMGQVAALINEGRSVSLRDVYYSNKHLFSNQSDSDLCVLELGKLLRLQRHEMHIIPASKGYAHEKRPTDIYNSSCYVGLVAGNITFKFDKSSQTAVTDGLHNAQDTGTPISYQWVTCDDDDLVVYIPSHVRHLLVIEKHGVFHRLCEDRFFE
jgi:DNA topoisomerase VI subunit A